MNILKHAIWKKRLPSVIGLIFLVLAIITITWLSRNTILFGTRAAAGNIPKEVTISNISDTTFTVSYVTDGSVLGTVNFGSSGKMDKVAFDNRDTAQAKPLERTTHLITIKNLTPETNYGFEITSGDQTFMNDKTPYGVTTASTTSDPSAAETIVKGKITLDNGNPANEALVYVSTNTSQVLSALTDASGSYQIAIKGLRTKDLSAFINLLPNTLLQLRVMNATQQSQATALTSQTNPVPMIILSKNYDFAVSSEPLAPSPTASDSAALSGTPSVTPISFPVGEDESDGTTPQILTPQDEQGFQDQQPLFRGQGVPNQTVTITINSEQTITATVQTDRNGNWQYRPDEPLEPGNHTITIRTIDAEGIMRVITQSFVVYAEGSQFTEPSVSPPPNSTATPTPTRTPTPTTSANTPTPTRTTTTTPMASATATNAPSPTTQTTMISSTVTIPPIPVTGNTPLIALVIGIMTAVSIGALLFIFTTV